MSNLKNNIKDGMLNEQEHEEVLALKRLIATGFIGELSLSEIVIILSGSNEDILVISKKLRKGINDVVDIPKHLRQQLLKPIERFTIITNQDRLERNIIFTPLGTELFVIEIIAEGLLVYIFTNDNIIIRPHKEFDRLGIAKQSFIYSGPFILKYFRI